MFNIRTSLFVLAAAASVATALVTSTSPADARGGMGGFRGGFHGGFNGRAGFFRQDAGLNRFPRHHHHHVRPHRPWVYGVGVGAVAVAAPAYAAASARPAPAPCTCLSKEYTQDRLVVFKDRCTNEVAAAELDSQEQSEAQAGSAAPLPPMQLPR